MPPEEIEKLVVVIESDISKLLKETREGVDKAESNLQKLERTGKRAFAALKVAATGAIAALTAVTVGITAAFRAAEQGLNNVRIRRSFEALARSVGQSSRAIIEAMQQASGGTIRELELMRQANIALQLGVARTPEEFDKLVRSAIILGRSVGRGPVEALDDLINAAGRRSTEVLDNLGISLSAVNTQMEEFAQQEFGQSASQLDQAARNALFMRAALEVADRQAQALGGSVEDIGTSIDQTRTQIENFKNDTEEAFLVVVGKATEVAQAMQQSFFGPDGIFPLFVEGGNIVAEVFAQILAGFLATAATIARTVNEARQVFAGDLAIGDFADPNRIAANFTVAFAQALNKIKADFDEVFDPGGAGDTPTIPILDDETINKDGEGAKQALDDALTALLDLQEETNAEMETNLAEHNAKMEEIERNAAQKFLEINQKFDEQLAKAQAAILKDAQDDLIALQQDTDRELKERQDEFNREELRETEDHLTELRRLRLRFLDDLQDAVKNRDARAVVDLRRRFQRENQERTDDFETQQRRERQDSDRELAKVREDERRRAQEIIDQRTEALDRVEARVEEARARELDRLEANLNEQRQKEIDSFNEAQAELENALVKRLEAEAKALADQDEITETGAQKILETLANFFGVGGEIDQLMEDFRNRRSTRMAIQVRFEEIDEKKGGSQSKPSAAGLAASGPQFQFAQGGTLLARGPTLAMFGEAGPEVAQFMPLSQMNRSATSRQTQRVELDINMRGSAPPGIRSGDRDQIASVLVQALREAGVMRR